MGRLQQGEGAGYAVFVGDRIETVVCSIALLLLPQLAEPDPAEAGPARQHLPRRPTRRYLGAVAAAAFAGLLLLAAVVAWLVRRPSQRGTAAEQEEALLYSHIPGTPAKPSAALSDKHTAAWSVKQGRLDAVRASGAIPKKLSNLPA